MKIHLIGICGTGMGSLAGLLKAAGHTVRGSDSAIYPPMSTQLAEQGIEVMDGFRPENLSWTPDVVVVGNVCTKDHVEAKAAQERGLKLTSFPALLEELFLTTHHSMVVAGTHGKTTTSSLLSYVLSCAGKQPSFLVGGVPENFGRSWGLGRDKGLFVIEGDEYDTAFFDKGSKFFHYRPKTAILTAVELDHIDIFNSLEEVKAAFSRFVALIEPDGLLIVAADSPEAMDIAKTARCRVETYLPLKEANAASAQTAHWTARVLATRAGGRTLFEVARGGEAFGMFDIGLPGRFNLANALAVIAASANAGLTAAEIAPGIRHFAGVRRRQQICGVAQGVTVIDDFAHHPTAVRETILGVRGRHGSGRMVAVFEPRSATSRRGIFQQDYAAAFSGADEVIIGAVDHPEKAPPEDRFDPERLAQDLRGRGIAARHLADVDQIVEQIASTAAAGDTVVVMSSGGFGNIHDKLLTKLDDAVVPARSSDLAGLRSLLERTELKYPDLEAHLGDALVMRGPDSEIVSMVVLELYDEAALLRSLATRPERRGEGLGWMMAEAALDRARARGCRRVFLVTESASDFFAEKFGFRTVNRELVDAAVLKASAFDIVKNGTTMVRDLGE